jgi:hypothetical protein
MGYLEGSGIRDKDLVHKAIILSLRGLKNAIYNHYYVICYLRYENDFTLYLEKLRNFGEKGNGKIAVKKILEYMKRKGYLHLRTRVYPLDAMIGKADLKDVLKLIEYYEGLGFELKEEKPQLNPVPNAIEMMLEVNYEL